MTSRPALAALIVVAAGCATGTTATGPAPEPSPKVARVPLPTPPRIIPNVRLASLDSNAVPPFAAEPLITWGAAPEGTVHPVPARRFDLRHQTVKVRFDWARHAVIGSTTLRLAALDSPITSVSLNAVGMTIARVRGAGASRLRFDYDDSVLVVHLARPLRARALTTLTIDYESVRPKKGAYFIDRTHYLWTQGETEDTRYWVPTYDRPDDKTTWSISITTSPDEKALSNGRLVSSRRVAGGMEWDWSQDMPASTYLMSVVTGRYAVVRDRWNNVPVEYWTYPDSIAAARLGFGRTPRAMEVFSQKTGVPYPWAKYAQSVVPDFIFGGMENVTATTQNDNGILHPAWADQQRNADGLMSHELGHQWYGDLLTTRDWSHAWLNEGFATFMEQTFREVDRGVDEGAFDRLEAQRQTIDADRRNRRPIVYNRWVSAPFELFFSGHIYPKGATVLQMLRHQLGDSLFWHAMNRYTVEHEYQNVVTEDLRRSFEKATGRDFKAFFDQWVYGAGFPVFQVVSAYDTTAKQLTLRATEVQPRDSITGYFDADVDVEVLGDSGSTRGVMRVRDGRGELTLSLRSAPRAVDWNKGKWILAISDFPRSTVMLAHQLAHSDDATSRAEAVDLLHQRTGQPAAAHALATAATSDRFWGVRAAATRALAEFATDSLARAGAAAALGDSDARVRQSAAEALARFPGGATPALLATAAERDSSLIVRGVALASYLTVEGDAGLPLAGRVMGEPSWLDVLRAPALQVLKNMSSGAARELYLQYAKADAR